jgi:hypothetical protein
MADLDFYTQSVRFRVDGKAYVGCMDIDALGELQKIWGIDGLADMQKRVENVGFAEMKDIVFVSLLRDQPQITRAGKRQDRERDGHERNRQVRLATS